MTQQKTVPPIERFGVEKRSRGGGQPKPRTPSGETKNWKRPISGTTPADREKQDSEREV